MIVESFDETAKVPHSSVQLQPFRFIHNHHFSKMDNLPNPEIKKCIKSFCKATRSCAKAFKDLMDQIKVQYQTKAALEEVREDMLDLLREADDKDHAIDLCNKYKNYNVKRLPAGVAEARIERDAINKRVQSKWNRILVAYDGDQQGIMAYGEDMNVEVPTLDEEGDEEEEIEEDAFDGDALGGDEGEDEEQVEDEDEEPKDRTHLKRKATDQ